MNKNARAHEIASICETIIRDTNSAICVFKTTGEVVSFNNASLVMSGATAEEASQVNFHNLDSWKSCQIYEDALKCINSKALIEGQATLTTIEFSQKTLYVQYTFSIIHQDEKEYLLMVLNDKTEEKIAEKAMAQAEQLGLLAELSAGIVHEINNPLTIILTLAGLTKMQLSKSDYVLNQEAMKEIFDKIELTAKRMVKTVRGLRSISRAAIDDPFQPESLQLILSNVLEITRYRLKIKKVSLLVPEGLDRCTIECHEGEVVQILVNLVNNSFDALQSEGVLGKQKSIRVEVKVNLEDVEIRVIDNGPGIPASIRKKIMTPFFTTKSKGKGTGLGLSLSQKMAKRHGGELFLDESVQETCFVLRLPKKQKQKNIKAA